MTRSNLLPDAFFEKMILNTGEAKDLDQCYVRPDLGPNCLQKLAALAAKDAADKVGNIYGSMQQPYQLLDLCKMFHPKWLP